MTITPPLTRVRLVGATTTAAPTHQARSKAAVLALRALVFAGAVGTGAAAVAATQTLFASESGGKGERGIRAVELKGFDPREELTKCSVHMIARIHTKSVDERNRQFVTIRSNARLP